MKHKLSLLLLSVYTLLAQAQTDGTLDLTFGNGKGYVATPGGFFASSVTVGASDGIFVGGSSTQNSFQIVRYFADGTLNQSFGSNGVVLGPQGLLFDVLLTPDEYIITGGQDIFGNLLLARFYKDGGYIDSTFGSNGIVTASEGFCSAIAQQTDLYIVAGGATVDGKFLVLRYTPYGMLDTTFEFGPEGFIEDLLIQDNGKIIACGVDDFGNFSVVRYNTDGSIDRTFGVDGIATGPQGMATSLAIQPNGYIVVAGYDLGSTYDIGAPNNVLLARFDANGNLDNTFGLNGVVQGWPGVANSVALQADGKIILAGSYESNCLVARYNTDGSPDTTFNGSGFNTSEKGLLYGAALQKDGNVIVVGLDDTNNNFLVARYVADNPLVDTAVILPLASSYGTITIAGVAQNSSNIYIFIDGTFVGGTTTYPYNSNLWTYTTTINKVGMYTIRAFATYPSGSTSSAGTNRLRVYGA